MPMTEDAARTKWCPMVRCGSGDDNSAVNCVINPAYPDARSPQYARCIASGCAMWRFEAGRTFGHCGLRGFST